MWDPIKKHHSRENQPVPPEQAVSLEYISQWFLHDNVAYWLCFKCPGGWTRVWSNNICITMSEECGNYFFLYAFHFIILILCFCVFHGHFIFSCVEESSAISPHLTDFNQWHGSIQTSLCRSGKTFRFPSYSWLHYGRINSTWCHFCHHSGRRSE